MIPPCDPSILKNNPDFKKLHEHVTTSLLQPDGSTRPVRQAAVRQAKGVETSIDTDLKEVCCLFGYLTPSKVVLDLTAVLVLHLSQHELMLR
jgi:hypothetical protein